MDGPSVLFSRFPLRLRILLGATGAALLAHLAVAQAAEQDAPAAASPGGSINPADPSNRGPDPMMAEVDGRAIHLSEVGDAVRALPGGGGNNSFEALYPLVLGRLVERTVLVLRAQGEGVADDPVVRRHMQEAADQALEDDYLRHVTMSHITEQALLARYAVEIKGKPGPEEVRAWVILMPTESAAAEVIAKLAAGADFDTLARQVSKDASSATGGDLGFVRREGLSPELGAVLFELRPAEVAPYPVRTAAGWFVLKAEARRQAATPTFAEARDGLVDEMAREQAGSVAHEALKQSVVHLYNLNGLELSGDAPAAGEAGSSAVSH